LVSENKKGEDDDYRAVNLKVDKRTRDALHEMILKNPLPSQQRDVSSRLVKGIGKQDPITEPEIKAYVARIVGGFSKEQIAHALANESAYIRKIKGAIKTHSNRYIEKQFYRELDVESIFLKPGYNLPASITPKENAAPIHKSLYQHEELMGLFELGMISKIADLDNVLWWHKNSSSKGFHINGCINHYPDFIIQMASGKVILLEAKGDDRDNSDSAAKLKLGKAWEKEAGREFRYMMVFNNNAIDGAKKLADALEDMERM
jgi:type III restriction enzyme